MIGVIPVIAVEPHLNLVNHSEELTAEMLETLVQAALDVRARAHAPYSRYQVGAALWSANGEIYQGCNVENVSYSLTICAERVAASSALAAGQSVWRAIVIASRGGIAPCGACRQFLAEFGDLRIIMVDTDGDYRWEERLSNLLPRSMERSVLEPRAAEALPPGPVSTGDQPG